MFTQLLTAYFCIVSVWLLFWVPAYSIEKAGNGDTKIPAQAIVASPLSPLLLVVFVVLGLYHSIISIPKIFREAFSKD